MLITLLMAAAGIFLALQIPVIVALRAALDTAFRWNAELKILSFVRSFPRPGPARRAARPRLSPRDARRAARYMLKALRVKKLFLSFRDEDACRAALLYGFARSLFGMLPAAGRIGRVRARLGGPGFAAEFEGILSFTVGQGIFAALLYLAESAGRKGRKAWKSIRSKASCQAPWRAYATWWTSIR